MGTFSDEPRLTHLPNVLTRKLDELEATATGENIEDLTVASEPLDGTEKIAGVQGGNARAFTTEQLAGSPLETQRGTTRAGRKFYTDFTKVHPLLGEINTNGTIIEDGIMLVKTDQGNVTGDVKARFAENGALLSTHGVAPAGVPGMAALVGPSSNYATEWEFTVALWNNKPWENSSGNCDSFIGVYTAPTDAYPTAGFGFAATTEGGEVSAESNFWRIYCHDGVAGSPYTFLTAVPVADDINNTFFPLTVLKMVKSSTDVKFYINGSLVDTVDFVADMPYPTTAGGYDLYYQAMIRKETAVSNASMLVNSFKIEDTAGMLFDSASYSEL